MCRGARTNSRSEQGPKQANRAQGGATPQTQNPYFRLFSEGLGPGNPLFELGRPVASGMQSSFPILVDFGPETSHPHVFGHDYYNVFVPPALPMPYVGSSFIWP